MSMTTYMESHLYNDEILGDRIKILDGGRNFDIWPVYNKSMRPQDLVLLDVRGHTGDSVLIGGEPLRIRVLRGVGILTMLDLKIGGPPTETPLVEGARITIPSEGIVYKYTNIGEGNLIVRDFCPNFDEAHEPRAEVFVGCLMNLMLF